MNHGDAARFCNKPPRSLELTFHTGNGHGGSGIFTEYPAPDLARSLRALGAHAGQHANKQGTSAIFPGNFYAEFTFIEYAEFTFIELSPPRHICFGPPARGEAGHDRGWRTAEHRGCREG